MRYRLIIKCYRFGDAGKTGREKETAEKGRGERGKSGERDRRRAPEGVQEKRTTDEAAL